MSNDSQFKALLTLITNPDIARNSTKFTISTKFELQIFSVKIFHKKIQCLLCKLIPNCV